MTDPTLVLVFAVIGFWCSVAIGVASTLEVLARRHQWIRARQVEPLLAHMARHPAGRALFSFRARPCGHLLHAPSLDVIEMEHIEFHHVLTCVVAEEIVSKGEAA